MPGWLSTWPKIGCGDSPPRRGSTGGTGWARGFSTSGQRPRALRSDPMDRCSTDRSEEDGCTEARGWRAARCWESRSRSPLRRWPRRRASTPTTTASCRTPSRSTRSGSIVAGCLVMFMQAGFAFLEIGFSRGKNVGTIVAKILVNFSIAAIMYYAIGFAFAFGVGRDHRPRRLLPARLRRPAEGVPGHGPVRRDVAVEVVLPVRLLRRLAGDRLGHDARADQVRRLHHLRDRLRRVHLPDRVALGVRRRLAAVERRHAGLRRLDGRPHDRRDRRAGGAAAARAAARGSTAPTASRGRSPATTCRCSGWRS